MESTISATDGTRYKITRQPATGDQTVQVSCLAEAGTFIKQLPQDDNFWLELNQSQNLGVEPFNKKQSQNRLVKLLLQSEIWVVSAQALPAQSQEQERFHSVINQAGDVSSMEPATVVDSGLASARFAYTRTESCPISMVSGEELLSVEEFTLPGPVPLLWRRFYRSGHSRDIGLGHGWTHSACEYLLMDDSSVELYDDEGRSINFKRPAPGQRSRHLHENLELDHVSQNQFILREQGLPDKVFELHGSHVYRLVQIRHRAYRPALEIGDGIWEQERGFALNMHFDIKGRLIRIVGNWGAGVELQRDEQGRIVRLFQLDAKSRVIEPALSSYQYDHNDDLIAHQDADGHGEQYQYSNHVICERTLASGFKFHFEWDRLDSTGRCQRVWGDRGIYDYRFSWDPRNNASTVTDSRDYACRFRYNQFGLITEEIDKEGASHRFEYNDQGKLVKITDPLGNIAQYHYDGQGRIIGGSNALGEQWGCSYYQGELSVFTDALDHRWQRNMNQLGLLMSISGPQGDTNKYEYSQNGLLKQTSDAAGRTTKYVWNQNAELIRQTDSLDNNTLYHYDIRGRITSICLQKQGQSLEQAQQQATTRYEYSDAGRVSKIINSNGLTVNIAYNAAGQLLRYVDVCGRITEYQYDDGLTQPSRRVDPAGNAIQYEYDKERNLTALINENGDRHQFFYDGNERLIKEIGFDGRTQHFKYNEAGHLVKHLDAGLIQTEFERDALGLLHTKTSQTLALSEHRQHRREQIKYRYDALGRLSECYNTHQYLKFHYDASGNVVKETRIDINDKRQRVADSECSIRHQYNILGLRVATILPDGQQIQYSYHQSLKFRAISLNGSNLTEVERDSLGQEDIRFQGELRTETQFDPQNRLEAQWVVNRKSKLTAVQRHYDYDQYGNISTIKNDSWAVHFAYDPLDRLKRCESADSEFFKFDPAGNILVMANQEKTMPGQVKGNRLLMLGDTRYDYDALGNLIRERDAKNPAQNRKFFYNLQNQLIEVQFDDQQLQTVKFKYDPLGRRIAKQDASGGTSYLWADNLLLQERCNNNSKTYIYEPGSYRPVVQVDDGEVYFYHLDHLGTPRELSNEDGIIVWKAQYQAYGNICVEEVDEVSNFLRFQGQYYDEETGLHYNRFRYYNPNSGSYISQDPIGLLGGVNAYQYAPNPSNWVDPLGLRCKEQRPYSEPLASLEPTTYIADNVIRLVSTDYEKLLLLPVRNDVKDQFSHEGTFVPWLSAVVAVQNPHETTSPYDSRLSFRYMP